MSLFVSNSLPTISLSISQRGIIDYKNNSQLIPACPGVYVWGFRFPEFPWVNDNTFLPYYVGRIQSSIKKRIQEHHDFARSNYNVIKSFWLPYFNIFWLTDTKLNQLSSNEIKLYRNTFFDYLNKKDVKEYSKKKGDIYKALDKLQTKGGVSGLIHTCHQIKNSINFYQKNFHLCWIEINPDDENLLGYDYKDIIIELEKYIYHNLVIIQGKKIVGEEHGYSNPKYNFIINQSSIININDRFLI